MAMLAHEEQPEDPIFSCSGVEHGRLCKSVGIEVTNRLAATKLKACKRSDVTLEQQGTRRTTTIRTAVGKTRRIGTGDGNTEFYQETGTRRTFAYCASAGGSTGEQIIGFDSQASFGITNDIRLFGGVPLKDDTTFIITDWANEERTCSKHGMTVFGPMIYSELAQGTILCGKDFYGNWTTTNESEYLAMTAYHRCSDLTLDFRVTEDEKVLSCAVGDDLWSHLCSLATGARGNPVTEGDEEVLLRHALSRTEYNQVLESVRFHECTCHASLTTMTDTLKRRVLNHCPIGVRDVDNIRMVVPFGCNGCLCGKSKHRSTNPHKERKDRVLEQRDEMVDARAEATAETLGIDLMFEDGLVFLVCVGKVLGYTHLVPVTSKKKTAVAEAIKSVIDDYRRNQIAVAALYGERIPPEGVTEKIVITNAVTDIESDNEGAFVAASIEFLPEMGIHSTFVASGEHVGYVERAIRTIRERTHSTMVGLRWSMDAKLKKWLMLNVTNWINILSCKKSPNSAWSVLTRRVLNYRDLTTTTFGELVVAHRTVASLAPGQANGELGLSLGPVLNNSAAIYFYSLTTKQVKIRRRFARAEPVDLAVYGLPANPHYVPPGSIASSYLEYMRTRPTPVVDSGEDTGTASEKHEPPAGSFMTDGGPPGEPLTADEEREHDVVPPVSPDRAPVPTADLPDTYDRAEHQRDMYEKDGGPLQAARNDLRRDLDRELAEVVDKELERQLRRDKAEAADIEKAVAAGAAKPRGSPSPPTPSEPNTATSVPTESGVSMPGSDTPLPTRVLPSRKARDRLYKGVKNQRARTKRRAVTRVLMRSMCSKEGVETAVLSFKTSNWKKALENLPEEAEKAISKEVQQIVNEYEVCTPSHERPAEYHRSVDLFDRKSDGTYKARLCVSVTQHGGVVNYGIDLYSPTIDMKVVFMILGFSLQSGLELTVWDVKGAFLKSPLPTRGVFVRVEPHVAEKMCNARPEWKEYLRRDGSLMLECNKAWYGLAASSALWNAEIHKTLTEECGYTQHSMVACLYYRKVRGRLCYIMLHVDDLGALMPPDGVERSRVKGLLESKYEEMKEQRGERVTYIGMEIYQPKGSSRFHVNMSQRIKTMGADFGIVSPAKMRANPAKTAGSFMSPPSESHELLYDVKKYRSLVMTMQYISLVRPHLKFHVSWLASRQSSPTVVDWQKAVHLAEYMLSTADDVLTIKPSGENVVIRVYTDASFDVHPDSRSHSGVCVFVGEAGCAVFASSNKQHCMTRSSTDAEIVAAEGGLFIGNYYRDVLEELGIDACVVQLQDNLSCISLVETGTRAYDKKERHMVRRINFLKEYVDRVSNRTSLTWCPTDEMTADALTKDLHAAPFEKHKRALLGTEV